MNTIRNAIKTRLVRITGTAETQVYSYVVGLLLDYKTPEGKAMVATANIRALGTSATAALLDVLLPFENISGLPAMAGTRDHMGKAHTSYTPFPKAQTQVKAYNTRPKAVCTTP